MLRDDRIFWGNVSEGLEREQRFDKELKKLLSQRVEEFYSESENLAVTEKKIRCYCEVIGGMMALKDSVEKALKTNDWKEISARVIMQDEWPEEIWSELNSYFDSNGILYEFNKEENKIFLFRDEECAGLIGDEYEMDEFGDPVDPDQYPVCTNCVECPGQDECMYR